MKECPTCHSKGWEISVLGPDRCTFCDGTYGGNPPTYQDKMEYAMQKMDNVTPESLEADITELSQDPRTMADRLRNLAAVQMLRAANTTNPPEKRQACYDNVLLFEAAARLADATWWRPIKQYPQPKHPEEPVEVFARERPMEGKVPLPNLIQISQWHPDAGFCICEIREETHWRPFRNNQPPEEV